MREPKLSEWKVSWNSRTEIVKATSKFGAKKIAKNLYNISIGTPVSITPVRTSNAKV